MFIFGIANELFSVGVPKSIKALLKTPILERISENNEKETLKIESDLFEDYVKRFRCDKGILLRRKYYGIVARK